MAGFWSRLFERFRLSNAPATGGSAINRDPKAIQVKRVGYQISQGGTGRESFEAPRADLNVIAAAIERDSYIAQAVMRYRELIFKSGWSLQGRSEEAIAYLKRRLDMIAIASQTPTEDLFQGIADDVVRYSNSFVVKARSKNGKGAASGMSLTAMPPSKDPVGGYFRLPPQTMEISRDANGTILKYKQTPVSGGEAVEFRPEDMVHITANRPVGESFGLPWLAGVIEDVRLLRKVEENVATMLYRHTFPLLTYTVGIAQPGYESTDDEIEALRGVIESIPTDGAFILPERHKVEAIDVKSIDAKPYLDYFENRVFTGLGMSAVDMGRGDTANRSTADAMSGMKADRVKGWQQQIQVQIDKFIIEELLVEGGFDPFINPDYDINFVFNEIEHETRIKMETHEIYKFEHNLQTFDETRKNLGLDPSADESRLHFQMMNAANAAQQQAQDASAEDGEDQNPAGNPETDNKQKPENQSGTRSGPKRSTESLKESMDQSAREASLQSMYEIYTDMEEAIVNRMSIRGGSQQIGWMVNSAMDAMRVNLFSESLVKFAEGFAETAARMNRTSIRTRGDGYRYVIEQAQRLAWGDFAASLSSRIAEKMTEENAAGVRSVIQSMRYRLSMMQKTAWHKSHNYGAAIAIMASGETSAEVLKVGGECAVCDEKQKRKISMGLLSSLDEMKIYDQIPPWHPNCECRIMPSKGGDFA